MDLRESLDLHQEKARALLSEVSYRRYKINFGGCVSQLLYELREI